MRSHDRGIGHRLAVVEILTPDVRRQELSAWKKVIRVVSHEVNNSLAPVSSLVHSARVAAKEGDLARAFARLERAHVLGQSSTRLHVLAHWHMLQWGLRRRSAREVFGQLMRLAGAATKTPVGLVPTGNTGGANVSPIRRMAIAPELQSLIDAANGATAPPTLD